MHLHVDTNAGYFHPSATGCRGREFTVVQETLKNGIGYTAL